MSVAPGAVKDGSLKTSTVNSAGIPIDMERLTKEVVPKSFTTLAIVSKFGDTVITDSMEHKYRERRPIRNYTTISVADAIGQTNIEVSDPTFIKNDQVLWIVRDGVKIMQLLVQDSSIDATVDVVMFGGTVGSGALTSATEVGDVVVIGSEAHAEGEAPPTAYTNISTNKEDKLMQCDRAVKKTDIEQAQGHYDQMEKGLARDRKMAFLEEKNKMNLHWYFGEETKETTSAGIRRYAVAGLFDRLTENNVDYSGVGAGLTVQGFQEIVRLVTDGGPEGGNPVFMAGVNANNHISSWVDGSVRVSPGKTKWGVKVRTICTQYGDVDIVYESTLSDKYGVADRSIMLEQKKCRKLQLRGKPVRLYANITNARDIHNIEDAISGTHGIQTSALECFAQINGVS